VISLFGDLATMAVTTSKPARSDANGRPSLARLALSKHEAADALGVSVDYLEQHVMHEVRVVRRGRRRLIPIRELERWLDQNACLALESARAPLNGRGTGVGPSDR
jgi:excisionase family DNA binding protein